jgi:hypothetical protein
VFVYGGIIHYLWNTIDRFLKKEFERISCFRLDYMYTDNAFLALLYFSFFCILLYVLFPKPIKATSRRIQFFETKSRILTRTFILLIQFLCVCGILYIYYYFTRKHDCTELAFPGKCGCAACALRPLSYLYAWIILYAFIVEPIYNWCKRILPDFVFKFDRKFVIILVCSIFTLLLTIALRKILDFSLPLNFDWGEVLYIVFMLPFIYMIACGYNVFLSKLEKRSKILNVLLILIFAAFPFLFPFLFCIFDYILRKKNIRLANFN